MRAHLAVFFAAATACLASASPVMGQGDEPIEQAVQLANQGNVDRAIQVLRGHVNQNAKDMRARDVLGRILDFDGRPDEAVTLWEAGLTGAAADFPLLMSIGEIRHRQGRDGPTISYRRGTVAAQPSKNEAEEERFKVAHLEQAATAYEKARKLRPDEPEAASGLASVYSAQEKYDAAALVWKSLVELEPKNGEYRVSLALATKEAGRIDEAAQHLKQAIDLNPRLAAAHEALADIQKEKGQAAEAEQSRKRAEFYKRLPSFCTLPFSEENRKTLESLNQKALVRKLADDPSEPAAEFLAVLCWSHPHNQLETQAFEALEARGEKTTPLLRALLEGAGSTCTIKSTAHILARRKADGLLEFLVKRLPGDVRGFAMDMDIAGSLDDLGDAHAVEALVQVLNAGDAKGAEGDGQGGPLVDRDSARARAALALGAFDTPEARRALLAGTKAPEIAGYCWAALYRLSKDPKHLAALEKAVNSDKGYMIYLLGNYLLNKVGTADAKKLAQTWEKQQEADEAQREAECREKENEAMMEAPQDPAGSFVPEENYGPSRRAELIAGLEAAPALLRQAVAGLSGEQLDVRYRNWTIRQIVHHVADSHVNAYIRFKWTLTEDQPTIKAYDEARWVALEDSLRGSIEPPLALLEGLHVRWVQMLRSLTEQQFGRAFTHPETGKSVSLVAALCYYAWHSRHHTAQITWLREQHGWHKEQ